MSITTPPDSLTAAAQLPRDLSPLAMFLSADAVVQAVMVGLLLASVATWSVWLAKLVELRRARCRAASLHRRLSEVRSLADAARVVEGDAGIEAHLVRAAAAEVRLSAGGGTAGLTDRVASCLDRVEAAAGRAMSRGTGILASIGATAPFVGLFGTVWGIMNSFVGISKAQTTNLAVVAPGIAEALLATAIGLVAAIPAVVIYNALARSVTGYRAQMADLAAQVRRMVSRDLDRRAPPLREAAQ